MQFLNLLIKLFVVVYLQRLQLLTYRKFGNIRKEIFKGKSQSYLL